MDSKVGKGKLKVAHYNEYGFYLTSSTSFSLQLVRFSVVTVLFFSKIFPFLLPTFHFILMSNSFVNPSPVTSTDTICFSSRRADERF